MWYDKYVFSLENVDEKLINDLIADVGAFLIASRKIFICGNGGSMSVAEHFASDLMKDKDGVGNFPKSVFSGGSNKALMSAIGNDQGYDDIFVLQAMQSGINGNDLIISFSVSGMSTNIMRMREWAQKHNINHWLILGVDTDILQDNESLIPVVHDGEHSFGICESVFSTICHEVAFRVREALKEKRLW